MTQRKKEDDAGDALSRRRFLGMLPGLAGGAALAGLAAPLQGRAPDENASGRPVAPTPSETTGPATASDPGRPDPSAASWEHPEPRPDVDASGVLTADELAGTPDVVEIYDGIRQIPHIADGIRCHCGCADLPHTRSLLSCYEEGGMARYCAICQGEGRLAHRRWKEGQSLDQIRRAIDARYGPRSGTPVRDPDSRRHAGRHRSETVSGRHRHGR